MPSAISSMVVTNCALVEVMIRHSLSQTHCVQIKVIQIKVNKGKHARSPIAISN